MNYNIEQFKRPMPFEKGTLTLWQDEYVAQNVIAKHMDFEIDCGSRKLETINKAVDWIGEKFSSCKNILDIGCGPGLYAGPLCKKGFNYDGIDISKYQVEFARRYNSGLDNAHFYTCAAQDFKTDKKYDAALMLYALYAMQNSQTRKNILFNLKKLLNKNGAVFVEVFNKKHYLGREEKREWNYIEKNGFWSPNSYLELHSFLRYDELQLVLVQTGVMGMYEGVWNSWMQLFSKGTLIKEFEAAGFSNFEFYSSCSGNKFDENSDILCMCAYAQEE